MNPLATMKHGDKVWLIFAKYLPTRNAIVGMCEPHVFVRHSDDGERCCLVACDDDKRGYSWHDVGRVVAVEAGEPFARLQATIAVKKERNRRISVAAAQLRAAQSAQTVIEFGKDA